MGIVWRFVLLITILLFFKSSFAQNETCDLTLKGLAWEKATHEKLSYASVYLVEAGRGTISNDSGFFRLNNLCPGKYHLKISHIGCETQLVFIEIRADTFLQLNLQHHTELLRELHIHGAYEIQGTEIHQTIGKQSINENAHKSFAEVAEQISGVSIIKTGQNISKPILHGMYGNRLAIVNNGLEQAGQQWGNDHAPELDPFLYDHISIIKGTAALAYGNNTLGAAILAESSMISDDPHVHGEANYFFNSNGLGNQINLKLEKAHKNLAWRFQVSGKKMGDAQTPDYYLRNTGMEALNASLQVQKDLFGWSNTLHISTFNTKIGLLKGSHVGNLTDLKDAITRDVPLLAEPNFSYEIDAPKQIVKHTLVKFTSKKDYKKNALTFEFGFQQNNRKEFDIRRRSYQDKPALSLWLYNTNAKFNHVFKINNTSHLKSGIQYLYTNNTNKPETEILPLIPDYVQTNAALYSIYHYQKNRLEIDAGGRIELRNTHVAGISSTIPRRIERFHHSFVNYSTGLGLVYRLNKNLNITINNGFGLRSPEVNELHSAGLHQGVSGIERGNVSLQSEKSFKSILGLDYRLGNKFFSQVNVYVHRIDDYVFLQPMPNFELTIRGAFPVFEYKQTDAILSGLDIDLLYELNKNLKWQGKASLIKGKDVRGNIPLVYMPANNFYNAFTYIFNTDKKHLIKEFQFNTRFVAKQNFLLPEQDFLAPPEAYWLIGSSISGDFKIKEQLFGYRLSVENLGNTRYRDYLNRLRYFSDERGINATLRIAYKF